MGIVSMLAQLRSAAKNPPAPVATPPAKSASRPVAVAAPRRAEVAADKVPSSYRAVAAERLRFVTLVQRAVRSGLHTRAAVDHVAAAFPLDFPLLSRAGQNGATALNYPNFRNWQSRMRKAEPGKELDALCDRYSHEPRPCTNNPLFWQVGFASYLNPNRLPVSRAYRIAVAAAQRDNPDAPIPSYPQFRRRILALDPKEVLLARDGEEAFKNKYGSFIERDWSGIEPGEIVVCDSRTFDTRVRVWDDAGQRWVAKRPTIAGMMDARSWFLVSHTISFEAINSEMLIDTLGLYLYNTKGEPPAVAYCDNGSDYCAAGFSTPLAGTEDCSIFNELGIKLVNAIPYNARAKTIERCFRDMMQQFDKTFADYLGSRPGERTQAADYYDKHAEDLPTLEEFYRCFLAWLEEYHNTPKLGKIHNGSSPISIWRGRHSRPAIPPERLPFCFLRPVGIRKVVRGPAVVWQGTAYRADQLFDFMDQKVIIKLDRQDPTHVFCFDLAGRLIAEAKTKPAIDAMALDDAEARAAIAEEMRRQRTELKSVYTAILAKTGGLHLVSPRELLSFSGDAELVKSGELTSVKGAAHHYTQHILAAATPDNPATAAPAIAAAPAADDEDIDISDFNSFIINNNKGALDE